MSHMLRGRVYRARLANMDEDKYFVVVSNNVRNRKLQSVLAARLTTSSKPQLPSIIEIPQGEPFVGRIVCDDIIELWDDEIRDDMGAFSAFTMRAVDSGLKAALQLA